MPIPDVSTTPIYEGELPDVDSMSEVTDVRVITATGSGSEKVPIGEFKLPSSRIPYNPSVSGLEATNTKEAIDELTAKVSTKEAAVNKKTVINDSDTEFPTSKAVKTALDLKVDDTQIYNGLDKTVAGFALDARQGKEIYDNIDNLSGEIGSESLARTAGDNALQASIENLSGEVGSESLARTAGDNALQASIENLSGEVGSESLARTAGDNALQASIDQEISDRQTEIQGLAQTVNSNTEEIQNEITNRTQTVNALRNELLNKSIGSIDTGAEEKPAEGVSRRYRFTDDGNCYFTDVLNGFTSEVMPVPFQVSKDDELSVIIFDGDYTYRYFPTTTALKNSIGSIDTVLGILTGDISGDIDLAIQEMQGV